MKVAYVTPRYGEEVIGGAELGARMLAERLVDALGWPVEVFTTCALDARTWADEYPPGDAEVNGVTVHRIRSRAGRDPGFEAFSAGVLADFIIVDMFGEACTGRYSAREAVQRAHRRAQRHYRTS